MGLYEFKPDDAVRFAQTRGIVARKHGNELVFNECPYCHGGSNKDRNTFAINLKTGAFNCKRGSCAQKGNMIRLAQDFADFSLGDGDGIDDYYLKRERFKKFARRPIETKDKAIEYMLKRKIPEEITRMYEITIKKDTDNVMVFPFIDDRNDLWFIKYRNIEFKKGVTAGNKEWCEKDRKPILFGMNHCNFENKTLVMTEGQIDSLSCAAAGIENAVSVPLGKNGFTWVPYCFDFLGRFDELIIFGDCEDGEVTLLDGMRTRFHGKVKCVRTEDYKDCKDANELLVKYGPEALRTCIDNAEPCVVDGLKHFQDIQRVTLSSLQSMKTGITELDKRCPFIFGELIILTGAAGDGKSTLASQWATMAINQDIPTMIYSGELPDWMVKNWIDFQIAGRNNLNEYYDIEDETYTKITEWDAYSKNLYMYDVDSTEDNQETLFRIVLKGIQQCGIKFIIIDNLMTAMDNDGEMEVNAAQTEFTKRLAKIAQDRSVLIVLIVHPRKTRAGTFSNEDIAGSSNIVNRAHKIIRYARPDKEFRDREGRLWTKEDLPDCPIRMLTVTKDRITGQTITNGIPLYFEERSKRIWDGIGKIGFDWRLKWDPDEQKWRDAKSEELPEAFREELPDDIPY